MADAVDSKSIGGNSMGVRIPPPAPTLIYGGNNHMKKFNLIFILITALISFAASDINAGANNVSALAQAPGFTLKDISGKKVSLASFKGKPILLNFWATWCGYCRKERPHLNAIYNEYKDKGLIILAVSTDRSVDTVKSYLKKIPADFIVLSDSDGRVAATYGVRGYPSSFLIDRNGSIVNRYVGFREWTNVSSKKVIDALVRKE